MKLTTPGQQERDKQRHVAQVINQCWRCGSDFVAYSDTVHFCKRCKLGLATWQQQTKKPEFEHANLHFGRVVA